MPKQPKISVIVPAYNVENLIQETLNSVYEQTFQDFEIIVVDDGSTDETWNILTRYIEKLSEEDQKKICVFQQENAGPSVARNRGIQEANGVYITFLDSDDMLYPWYLEALYTTAEKGKDVVACGWERFRDDTKKVFERRPAADWYVQFAPGEAHLFFYSPGCKLIRKSYIERYHIGFVPNEDIEDLAFSLELQVLSDRIEIIEGCGYRYRLNPSSTMGQIRNKRMNPKVPYHGIQNALCLILSERPDRYEMIAYITAKALAGLLLNVCSTADKQTQKQLCAYCYKIIGTYFPNIAKNPYLKLSRTKPLPLSHRLAVKFFVTAYRMKLLYPFGWTAAKILHFQ